MNKLTELPPAEEIDPKAQAAMDILIDACLRYIRQKSATDKGSEGKGEIDGRAS